LVEWIILAGETEILWENLPRRHFVRHKSHLPDPGANPDRRRGKPRTNRFGYGTTVVSAYCQQYLSLINFGEPGGVSKLALGYFNILGFSIKFTFLKWIS
jgi:hypothetical protein